MFWHVTGQACWLQDPEGCKAIAACIADGIAPSQGSGIHAACTFFEDRIKSSGSPDIALAGLRFLAAHLASSPSGGSSQMIVDAMACIAKQVDKMQCSADMQDEAVRLVVEAMLKVGFLEGASEVLDGVGHERLWGGPLATLAVRIQAAKTAGMRGGSGMSESGTSGVGTRGRSDIGDGRLCSTVKDAPQQSGSDSAREELGRTEARGVAAGKRLRSESRSLALRNEDDGIRRRGGPRSPRSHLRGSADALAQQSGGLQRRSTEDSRGATLAAEGGGAAAEVVGDEQDDASGGAADAGARVEPEGMLHGSGVDDCMPMETAVATGGMHHGEFQGTNSPVALACSALECSATEDLQHLFPQVVAWLLAEGANVQLVVDVLCARLLALPKLAASSGGALAAAAVAVLWCCPLQNDNLGSSGCCVPPKGVALGNVGVDSKAAISNAFIPNLSKLT
jgi:hypothetical protein